MKLKRILALALCLAMVFTTMSFNAFATESVVYDAVALQDALSAGGAVTLGSDIELSETLEISEDVVIDLGGFTLSGELDTLIKATAGYIVITNGSIKNVRDNATTTLTSVYLTDNAVAQISDVAIETTGTGIYLGGSAKIIDLNATVKSYVDVNGYCAYDAISVNDNARIDVISGGTYTSNLSEKFIDTWKETHSYSATQSATIRVGSPDASIGEIRGGTFLGDMDKAFGGAVIYVNSGKIESISGGYFGFTKWGLTNPEKMVFVNTNNGGSIDEIVGGTFEKGTYSTGFGCDFAGIVEASGAFTRETGNTVDAEVQFSTKVTTYPLNILEVYAPVPVLEGKGTEANPYIVDSIDALKAFRDDVNAGNSYEGKYVKLTCDLDLSIARAIEEWIPVGNAARTSKTYTGNAFKGTFDGDNHTITGVSITSSASTDDALGLFGVVDGGAVKNLNLADVNIAVAGSDLAGGAIGMMLNNATADSISVSGVVAGDDGVGGIVGRMIINGTISNCTNNASVTATKGGIGGIVGKAYYEDGSNTSEFASVENCINNGTITSPSYIGGIVGLARANVNGCVNNGEIVGGTQTGGIVGQLVAAGKVEANENNAKISGTSHVGGIIGDYTQNSSYTYNKVTINNNTNSGELDSTGDCAAILGCNNIDGFTNIKASGNVSSYYVPGLEMFGNPEDMVIDDTNVLMKDVAKIGTTPYESLEEAFAAAVEGDTIVLLKNASPALTSQRAITKASVIDLNGKTLTLTEDDLYFGTTTFKNGSIVVDPSVRPSTAVFWMFANQTLTFEEVKLTASGVQGTYLIGLEGDNSNLNLVGSEIIVENDTALDLDIICVNSSGSNDILVEDTKVKVENLDGKVFFRGNYTICGDSDIDLSGITKSGIRIEKGQTLTIKDSAKVSITGTLRDGGIHLTDPYIVYTKADTATVDATVNVTASSLKGAGTEVDPYIISCLAELKWFRDNVDTQAADGSTQYAGKYIKLTADIDLAGENWNPIGSMAGDHGSFRGIFDGGNHTISNLNVQTTGNGLGLFARTTGNAVIKNLTLDNVTVKSTDNSSYVGGLVGNSYESTKIENVHVTGDIDISGRGYIGGISGHGYVVMDNVSVVGEGTIYSTFWCAGGILGYAGEGTTNIMNAHVEGITITSAAGGLGAIVGMAEDNEGTQPVSGSNLSAKDVEIKTYTGAYGDSYANYALGYLYGGNPTSKLTGNLSVEDVVIETSSGVAPSVNDAVATIRGTVYFSLQSAFDAVQDGETINVLRDITYGIEDCTYNDGTYVDAIRYTGDASFTVDFGGHTIQDDGCVNDYLVYINNTGAKDNEITFKNGSLISKNGCWSTLCVGAGTTLNKIVVNLDAMNIENKNGAEFSGNLAVKVRNMATVNANALTVITSDNASYGIATSTSDAIVNISGAKVVQKNSVNAGGNHTCAAVGGKGVISIYDGSEIISDASGVHTMTTGTPLIYVYGGTITAQGEAIVASTNGGAGEVSTVYVYGGNINGALKETNTDSNVVVSGGIFDRDVTEFLANGCSIKDNHNGTYGVINNNSAQIGDSLYATLQSAFDAAQDGDIIEVLKDVTINEETRQNSGGTWYEGVYYIGDKSFTVDLNGFTLTNNSAVNDYLVLLKNDGANANEITFKNGKLEATSSAYCALCTSTTSTQKITINLENVELVNNNSNGAVAKIRGGAVLNVKDGTVITGNDSYVGIESVASVVNIYDGAEIYQKGTSSYVGSLAGVSNNGTLNVYGGYGESAQGGFIAMTSGGTINVYGGQWIANTDGTYANDNRSVFIAQSENGAKSVINVTGGQFAGGYNCYGNAVGDAQINISGGNFNADPTAYIEDGYYVAGNAYGTYSVVAERSINVSTDAPEEGVVAGDTFTVKVKLTGKDIANARWKLEYNKDLFELQGMANNGTIYGYEVKEDETSVFADGAILAEYTFKAIAQTDVAYGDFKISDTYAYTRVESFEGSKPVTANNDKVTVKINLIDYQVVKLFDGNEVIGDKTISYDGAEHVFKVETIPTATVKYTVNGVAVTDVKITEVGTYNITYTVENAIGYAAVTGNFVLTVAEPEYVVEVNFGGNGEVGDYVAGKKIVLVYTNAENAFFKYDGKLMLDVTERGYKYNGTDEYEHVFAFVTTAIQGGELEDYEMEVEPIYSASGLYTIAAYDADLNFDTFKDLQDITTAYGVYNVNSTIFANIKYQRNILKADTNGDKCVDPEDTSYVITDVINALYNDAATNN